MDGAVATYAGRLGGRRDAEGVPRAREVVYADLRGRRKRTREAPPSDFHSEIRDASGYFVSGTGGGAKLGSRRFCCFACV